MPSRSLKPLFAAERSHLLYPTATVGKRHETALGHAPIGVWLYGVIVSSTGALATPPTVTTTWINPGGAFAGIV